MDFETIRPAISGVVGGTIASWLVAWWARRLPDRYRGWTREQLLARNRSAVWTANALFFLGLCSGVGLYAWGDYPNSDWRPCALGFGLASVLPLLALLLFPLLRGRSVSESFVAFALGQGTPMWATYGILGPGVVAFVVAVVALV